MDQKTYLPVDKVIDAILSIASDSQDSRTAFCLLDSLALTVAFKIKDCQAVLSSLFSKDRTNFFNLVEFIWDNTHSRFILRQEEQHKTLANAVSSLCSNPDQFIAANLSVVSEKEDDPIHVRVINTITNEVVLDDFA